MKLRKISCDKSGILGGFLTTFIATIVIVVILLIFALISGFLKLVSSEGVKVDDEPEVGIGNMEGYGKDFRTNFQELFEIKKAELNNAGEGG
jgi:hypothetical protein